MTAGVTVRAMAWFCYAILSRDAFYMISTSIGILSVIIQVILLLKYPRTVSKKLE
jgi:hypothetical protein